MSVKKRPQVYFGRWDCGVLMLPVATQRQGFCHAITAATQVRRWGSRFGRGAVVKQVQKRLSLRSSIYDFRFCRTRLLLVLYCSSYGFAAQARNNRDIPILDNGMARTLIPPYPSHAQGTTTGLRPTGNQLIVPR